MNLLTAVQDLCSRVARIPSLFGRMVFLARLRQGMTYEHWGLSRVYGKEATRIAILQAHQKCFLELLKSSFPDLLADASVAVSASGTNITAFLAEQFERHEAMAPVELGGGSLKHLDWMLFVLAKIAEAQSGQIDRVS